MRRLQVCWLALVALALLWSAPVQAQCTTSACPDEAAITAARTKIAADCDCIGAKNRGKYGKCIKGVMKSLLNQGSLSKACKKAVQKCEMQSTCGRKGAVVCCGTPDASAAGAGPVSAKVVKKASKCGGTACADVPFTADACKTDGTCAPPINAIKPFKAIQEVFTTSCALPTCHSALAREGGLVLADEDVSYKSLVDIESELPEANKMLRVKSGDPANSFLVQKLHGTGAGDSMPQNLPPLGDGTIGMIERWIERGAHTTDEECPPADDDTINTRPENFQPQHGGGDHRTICDPSTGGGDYVWKQEPPLEVPAASDGIQLKTPTRPVASGSEWETCIVFRPDWEKIRKDMGVKEGETLTIKRQEYRMHSGSHHLLVYGYFGTDPGAFPEGFFPCTAGQCHDPDDCPADNRYQIPIGGTQVAGTRYVVEYPEGVGIPQLSKDMAIIVNMHYTNPFLPAQDIFGEAWVNLYFHKPGEFKAILDGIFAINYRDLLVEPFETRTLSSIWQPEGLLSGGSTDAAVFQLFGHMHKRGDSFQIDYVRDGKCSVSEALCGRDSDCACKAWQRNCVTGQTCTKGPNAEDTRIYFTDKWDHAPVTDYPAPWMRVNADEGLRWSCQMTNGKQGDPTRPPKVCHEGCGSCGWDEATRTCIFTRGKALGFHDTVRTYKEGDPMPLVFGDLADDDMCNMFGYFMTKKAADALLGAQQ